MVRRQYEALAALAWQPNSVLVANPGVLAARQVQETLGVPTASLLLQPGLLPSNTAPPEMPGGLTIPAWLPHPPRRLYWLAVDAAGYALVAPSLNRVRHGLGLSPVRRVFRWWLSPDLVIGLFPGWYAAPQPDWPPQLRLAGFGRFDGTRDIIASMRQELSRGPMPLAFLCQLFLRDLHAANPLDLWPSEGSLASFHDPSQNWGFDPDARGHGRVFFAPEDEELIPVSSLVGLHEESQFPNRPLMFTPEWTLPSRLDIDGRDLSIWGNEDYARLLQRFMPTSSERELVHRRGGHPQEIQGYMRLECQLVTNGLYCGDATGYQDPRCAPLEPGAADWQLLLQIDSDEQRLGWMWGDVGRVYFWVRRQDLASADFEDAWAVLQCY